MSRSLQHQLKKKYPFELPEEEVSLNIQRTFGVLMGPELELFKKHKLSPPLYNILRILRGVGSDGLPCSQIGDRMVTRVPDMTRLIDRLEQAGLRVIAQRRIHLTKDRAEDFYGVHRERPFFADLVAFMTSGPIVVQVLEGEDAIARNREVMGATNPAEAAEGTIRKDFAGLV